MSVVPAGVDEDIRELIETIERQKNRIRLADATLLETESSKMFKNHNKIIEELSSRSKAQLRALFLELPNSLTQIELIASAGNQYAGFLSKLYKTKHQIELDSLLAEQDFNEELIIGILCTSTTQDIRALDQSFSAAKGFSMHNLLESKIKSGTSVMKFIDRIFQFRRDEGKEMNLELAETQADMIHEASSKKLVGVDEDTIFNILSTASRAQCVAINQKYLERHKMKLDRALNMKFKGLQAKLMTLWAMPIPMAISCWCDHLLHKMIVDRESLSSFIARFEKDTLVLANNACKEIHGGKGLVDNLKSGGISGNLLSAIRGWIEHPSPDKGFERILDIYLHGKMQRSPESRSSGPSSPSAKGLSPKRKSFGENPCQPLTLDDLVRLVNENEANAANGVASSTEYGREFRLKVKFLLEKETHELKLFMIDHQLSVSDHGDEALSPISGISRSSASSRMGFSWRSARAGVTINAHAASGDGYDSPGSAPNTCRSFSENHGDATRTSPTDASPTHATSTHGSSTHASGGSHEVPGGTPRKSRRHSQSLPSYDEKQESTGEDSKDNDLGHDSDGEKISPVPAVGGLIRQNSLFAQLKHVQERQHMDEHKQVDLVYNYLLPRFELKDSDGTSYLTEAVFWQTVEELPLDAFGLNKRAVNKIRGAQQSWLTYEEEHDTPIVYFYEALLELAETLVGAIASRVDNGEKSVSKVIDSLKHSTTSTELKHGSEIVKTPSRITMLKAASFRRGNSEGKNELDQLTRQVSAIASPLGGRTNKKVLSTVTVAEEKEVDNEDVVKQEVESPSKQHQNSASNGSTGNDESYEDYIPPYFLQYLLDTIVAFDLDMNHVLSSSELEMLVSALQVPSLTVSAFLSAPGQTVINPRDALKVVSRRIGQWFSPAGRMEDHYICLIDVQSGAYFWFNARDESSVWAETNYEEYACEQEPTAVAGDSQEIQAEQQGANMSSTSQKNKNESTTPHRAHSSPRLTLEGSADDGSSLKQKQESKLSITKSASELPKISGGSSLAIDTDDDGKKSVAAPTAEAK